MNNILTQTLQYASAFKNDQNFTLTLDEIKVFILAFYFFLVIIFLQQVSHYWSTMEDLDVSLVANSMSRNRFTLLKSYIHIL